jgi:hypothetical protein
MISPSTAKCIYQKYNTLPDIVKSLEPSEVSLILKSQRNLYAFYPRLGLFSTDFAVAYCNNLHSKSRSRQRPRYAHTRNSNAKTIDGTKDKTEKIEKQRKRKNRDIQDEMT